jgi:hypothetical protein
VRYEAAYDLADRLFRDISVLKALEKPDRRNVRELIIELANDAIEDGIEEWRAEGGSNLG